MNDKLYRKKNVEKMKTPDELNDYIRISGPGIWALIAALIILVLGACVWAEAVLI